ncbi:MAG: DUF362 domain-containing protein [Firmicutes bacterium]|nr:DUF362 domain-containing protein [Bacillota bacterium]
MPEALLAIAYGRARRELAMQVCAALKIERRLPPGATVWLKPNLVVAKPSSSGATTDPEIAAGVMAYLNDHGWRRFGIMESSWLGTATREAFRVCGYEEVARRFGAQLVDLKADAAERMEVEEAGLTVEVCRTALRAEAIIDLPVLKAHSQAKLTCALKNLKGCVPDREKRRFHALGLHRPIAALAKALPVALVVVDGVTGDLTFEEGGNPVDMDQVFGGFDPVLVDAYAAELIGYAPWEIPYLTLAEEFGVGSGSLAQARLLVLNSGEKPRGSRPACGGRAAVLAEAVEAREACSACYGPLLHAMARLKEAGRLPSRPVRVGQGFRGLRGEGPGVGSCTAGLAPHLPGCPPTGRAILDFLRDLKE